MDLKEEIIEILTYFKDGLEDIKSGSGEEQPMLPEIKRVLRKLPKFDLLDKAYVSKSLLHERELNSLYNPDGWHCETGRNED